MTLFKFETDDPSLSVDGIRKREVFCCEGYLTNFKWDNDQLCYRFWWILRALVPFPMGGCLGGSGRVGLFCPQNGRSQSSGLLLVWLNWRSFSSLRRSRAGESGCPSELFESRTLAVLLKVNKTDMFVPFSCRRVCFVG